MLYMALGWFFWQHPLSAVHYLSRKTTYRIAKRSTNSNLSSKINNKFRILQIFFKSPIISARQNFYLQHISNVFRDAQKFLFCNAFIKQNHLLGQSCCIFRKATELHELTLKCVRCRSKTLAESVSTFTWDRKIRKFLIKLITFFRIYSHNVYRQVRVFNVSLMSSFWKQLPKVASLSLFT